MRLIPFASGKLNIRVLSGAGVSAGFIAALVWLFARNAGDIPTLIRSFDPRFLAVAFLAHSGALFFAAVTWHRMMASLGRDGDSRRNIGIYVTTAFARRLPGSLWGPALRMYWYRQLGGDWRAAGAASVLEVWAISVSGILLAVIGIVFVVGRGNTALWIGASAGAVVLGATCIPSLNRWWLGRLLRFARPSDLASEAVPEIGELVRWVALEMGCWLLGGIELAALLRAVTPYDLSRVPAVISAWPIAGTAGALITFLPGGFGVVEVILVSLFQAWLPLSTALVATLGLRLFVTATEFVWMIVGYSGTALVRSRLSRVK